jgi:hypothetical protein
LHEVVELVVSLVVPMEEAVEAMEAMVVVLEVEVEIVEAFEPMWRSLKKLLL